jgi:hypothetical protein
MQVIDAVNFVRSNGLLSHWTNEQIAYGIKLAIDSCCISYTVDANSKLTSLCWGQWEDNGSTVNVILLAGEGSPSVFLSYLRKMFPTCKYVKFGRMKNRAGKTRIYKLLK